MATKKLFSAIALCIMASLWICDANALAINTDLAKRAVLYKVRAHSNSPSTDGEVKFDNITTTQGGQLADNLGDNKYELDSLIVNGPINAEDFRTMWDATFYGNLKVLNLEQADVEAGCIPNYAFYYPDEQVDIENGRVYCILLKRIILPENISSIGECAFSYAIDLQTINIPLGLRQLGKYAFSDCSSLQNTQLTFPEGLEKIEDYTFLNCRNLKANVILPSTIREIGASAFFGSKITSILLPEGLSKIGDAAFYGCRLKDVNIPGSCLEFDGSSIFGLNLDLETISLQEGPEYIPESFLYGCYKLQSINIPSSVKRIESYALQQCSSLKELEFPEGVVSIGDKALSGLSSLERVVFPSTLKTLGVESCTSWPGISEIYCKASEPPVCKLNEDANCISAFGSFGSVPQHTPLYVPIGSAEKYHNSMGWDYFTNIIEYDYSGINRVASDTISTSVSVSRDLVTISGLNGNPTDYAIYNISGMVVATGVVASEPVSLTLNRGIYLVKVGSRTVKISI